MPGNGKSGFGQNPGPPQGGNPSGKGVDESMKPITHPKPKAPPMDWAPKGKGKK